MTSVAAATTKFLLGMRDCTVDREGGMGNYSLVLGTLHLCGHEHVSPQLRNRNRLGLGHLIRAPKLLTS